MRTRHARKRGGDLTFTTLDDEHHGASSEAGHCGFTFAEIAAARGVAERTAQRDWAKARVLLRRFIDDALLQG